MWNCAYGSSRPEVFCKKGVLRNVVKFTGKHQCQGLFFIKVADLRPATLSKKRLWHSCFPVNLATFLRTPFLTEHLRWLLLHMNNKGAIIQNTDTLAVWEYLHEPQNLIFLQWKQKLAEISFSLFFKVKVYSILNNWQFKK